MLFWILVLIFIILAWLEIIPVRKWIALAKAKYHGKKTRFKISLIKTFEPFLNWIDQL